MRRLAALIYDGFLIFAITLGYGGLLLLLKITFNGINDLENIQPKPLAQWLSLLGWLVSIVGYYFICWRKQGQTLGMKAWRLRLQQIKVYKIMNMRACKYSSANPRLLACVPRKHTYIATSR